MKGIFVFGSNEAGVHGAGAARTAYREHGALWGYGYGPFGQSFAIPTKDKNIETLTLAQIAMYIQGFIAYAMHNPEKRFQVTRIGCGLAGLKDEHIAPLFLDAPRNCYFDTVWSRWLPEANTWGTF